MPKLSPKLGVTTKEGLQLLPKQGLMQRRRRQRVGRVRVRFCTKGFL